jgi:hypothetical protein
MAIAISIFTVPNTKISAYTSGESANFRHFHAPIPFEGFKAQAKVSDTH